MKRTHIEVAGVYAVTNTITGEQYVGCSLSVHDRLHTHKMQLRSGGHPNKRMQASATQHGIAAFSFVLLEQVEHSSERITSTKDRLYEAEEQWMGKLHPVFNLHIPSHLLSFAGPLTAQEVAPQPKTDAQKRGLIIALLRAQYAALEASSASLAELVSTLDGMQLETEALRDALAAVDKAQDILTDEIQGWCAVQALAAV